MQRTQLKRKGGSQQQRRNEVYLRLAEIGLERAVKNAKNEFIAACAQAFLQEGDRSFAGELVSHRMTVRMLLRQQAGEVIPRFARTTLDDIRRLSIRSDEQSYFERLIASWLQLRESEAAEMIASTTQSDVLSAMQAGILAGEGSETIARRIRKVTALSPYRSRVVARTETHMAALFAQAETARSAEAELGLTLVKEWVPTLDARTRDAHAHMASHPAIPLDQKFNVGGILMDRPGDPSAPASLVVNCRCTLIHKAAPDPASTSI